MGIFFTRRHISEMKSLSMFCLRLKKTEFIEKEVESNATQKREDKEMIQLHNGLFELKRELKKHESEPMNKAHPAK